MKYKCVLGQYFVPESHGNGLPIEYQHHVNELLRPIQLSLADGADCNTKPNGRQSHFAELGDGIAGRRRTLQLNEFANISAVECRFSLQE